MGEGFTKKLINHPDKCYPYGRKIGEDDALTLSGKAWKAYAIKLIVEHLKEEGLL
jgi:hypothetical protein